MRIEKLLRSTSFTVTSTIGIRILAVYDPVATVGFHKHFYIEATSKSNASQVTSCAVVVPAGSQLGDDASYPRCGGGGILFASRGSTDYDNAVAVIPALSLSQTEHTSPNTRTEGLATQHYLSVLDFTSVFNASCNAYNLKLKHVYYIEMSAFDTGILPEAVVLSAMTTFFRYPASARISNWWMIADHDQGIDAHLLLSSGYPTPSDKDGQFIIPYGEYSAKNAMSSSYTLSPNTLMSMTLNTGNGCASLKVILEIYFTHE